MLRYIDVQNLEREVIGTKILFLGGSFVSAGAWIYGVGNLEGYARFTSERSKTRCREGQRC